MSSVNVKICSKVDSFDSLLALDSNIWHVQDFRVFSLMFCILFGKMRKRSADKGTLNQHTNLTCSFSSILVGSTSPVVTEVQNNYNNNSNNETPLGLAVTPFPLPRVT